jgi:hypothetical protein
VRARIRERSAGGGGSVFPSRLRCGWPAGGGAGFRVWGAFLDLSLSWVSPLSGDLRARGSVGGVDLTALCRRVTRNPFS